MYRYLNCLMIAALVAAFLLPAAAGAMADKPAETPVKVGHVSVCFSVDTMASYLVAHNKTIERIAHLRGEDARAFMDVYNAIPPVTNHVADEVVGFYIARNSYVLFIAFEHGCYAGKMLVPIRRFRQQYPDVELPTGQRAGGRFSPQAGKPA